jgi:hypothetical protein
MTMEVLDLTNMGMLTTTMAITTTIMVDMREMDMTMMATKTICHIPKFWNVKNK